MSARCRGCQHPLTHTFCNLGKTPLANSYLSQTSRSEPTFPLHAYVCDACLLVQLEEYETPSAIFEDYAYFSSYSQSWLEHSRRYAQEIVRRLNLGPQSQVIEIASNDGYLLRFFQELKIPVLGIEPARNVAKAALALGIPTRVEFFGTSLAKRLKEEKIQADLLIANNVLAHVPNLNDFVKGMKTLLAPQGTITIEFPHLLNLIQEGQFDTIYHEHFSYFSLYSVEQIFQRHGLAIYDVETLGTHGGSLRVFCSHADIATQWLTPRLSSLRQQEAKAGLKELKTYLDFSQKVTRIKQQLISLLSDLKQKGKRIAAYGAPAKGNTLLNFCEIGANLIDFTVDRNPHKQGKLLPGSRIPIFSPEKILHARPDYILILPWNLQEEILSQLSFVKEHGGSFIVPIPTPTILS